MKIYNILHIKTIYEFLYICNICILHIFMYNISYIVYIYIYLKTYIKFWQHDDDVTFLEKGKWTPPQVWFKHMQNNVSNERWLSFCESDFDKKTELIKCETDISPTDSAQGQKWNMANELVFKEIALWINQQGCCWGKTRGGQFRQTRWLDTIKHDDVCPQRRSSCPHHSG